MSREQMKARLEGVLAYGGFPWRRCVSTSGTSHGVVDSSGTVQVYGTSGYAAADFFAAAPTDAQKLHAALDSVEAEIAATDLETNEALQADLASRIRAAIRDALGEDA
ncbi:hypothetical protein ACIPY0_20335 [Paenarthrobacter nicotinovorans]|uniref:hypothetical protein n=1 Tax=Paenarthrobacter nicotinovorans TaxID=29320 RepID=UPI0037FC5E0F